MYSVRQFGLVLFLVLGAGIVARGGDPPPGFVPVDFLSNPTFENGLDGWSVQHREWIECGGSATVTWSPSCPICPECGSSARLGISGGPGVTSVEQQTNHTISAGETITFLFAHANMAGFGNWGLSILPPSAFDDAGVNPNVHHTNNPVVPGGCRDQLHPPIAVTHHIGSGTGPEGCYSVEFEAPQDIEAGSWIVFSAVVWPGSASVWFQGVFEEGQDSDGDGMPDDEDACPESDLGDTIVIDDCDTGVGNELFDDGCTMADRIAECAEGATTHGEFVSCGAQLANDWKQAGLISGREKGRIQSCAAQGNLRTQCQADADCDDGLFCNGVEVCLGGACVVGDPCPGQSCDEVADECIQ